VLASLQFYFQFQHTIVIRCCRNWKSLLQSNKLLTLHCFLWFVAVLCSIASWQKLVVSKDIFKRNSWHFVRCLSTVLVWLILLFLTLFTSVRFLFCKKALINWMWSCGVGSSNTIKIIFKALVFSERHSVELNFKPLHLR